MLDVLLQHLRGRNGHFRYESGLHGDRWLALETLFEHPDRTEDFAATLASQLRPSDPDVVCGPQIGGAVLARLVGSILECEAVYTERVEDDSGSALFSARYRIPSKLSDLVAGRRVAMVDDAIGAGSSVRASIAALEFLGAVPVGVGTLLLTGDRGAAWLTEHGIPLFACARMELEMWPPDACPLCAKGLPLELVA